MKTNEAGFIICPQLFGVIIAGQDLSQDSILAHCVGRLLWRISAMPTKCAKTAVSGAEDLVQRRKEEAEGSIRSSLPLFMSRS